MNSTKLLNLRETLEIFFIVWPHIPKKYVTHYDACSEIFDALSPNDFLRCVCILTDIEPDKIIREDALEYFISFVEGLKANNILSLPDLFKRLGFIE